VHVTTRVVEGVPNLRGQLSYHVIRSCFAKGCDRFGFRLVHYSVQTNHLHLVAEAKDRRSLWRGLQGLFVRIAKNLNKLWGRKGRVLADRYHHRILRTPREVRNVLCYVLHNARRHGLRIVGIDSRSSGRWFDGWRDAESAPGPASEEVVRARTWLAKHGWRRHRLIGVSERPGAKPP
jgi:REP element-mobilizing transposase RayT